MTDMRGLLLGAAAGGLAVAAVPLVWRWVRRTSRTQVHRINQ